MPVAGASLQRYLMLGILVPLLLFILADTFILYRQALTAVNTAYDRTLLASAKSIGEQLDVEGGPGDLRLVPRVPYSALEAFEADNRSRMFYRVTGFAGELVSGFAQLPAWTGRIPDKPPYAALVDFYDDTLQDAGAAVPVRVAVLLQPVAGVQGSGMATVQVAETLELRQSLARDILVNTLLRQAVLVLMICLVVVWVVRRAVRPVRTLSASMQARAGNELSPLPAAQAPLELQPLVEAANQLMQRLAHLLAHQKRFVRDTAHQLRTPLAVLKTQTQSALRGDVPPMVALQEINATVERATLLANQMLALAKVEQLRQDPAAQDQDWGAIARELALELAPLVAAKDIDFGTRISPVTVRAHAWMLRELTRNLLHNAIRHTPPGGSLHLQLEAAADHAQLWIADSGPGIGDELRQRLFQPFSAGTGEQGSASGTGLGLAICHDIVRALGGSIRLDNRQEKSHVLGLDAVAIVPLAGAARP